MPGAGRADPEGDIVLPNRFDVTLLTERLGATLAFLIDVWIFSPREALESVGSVVLHDVEA